MISIKNIYWMLAYAYNFLDERESKKVDSENFENIYDLFCVLLTMALNKQIKRGLNKEYLLMEEETGNLKGKILVNKSIKNNSENNLKMFCSYDDYSSNSYLNRIAKTACLYLLRANKVTDKFKAINLKKTLLYFNDVGELDIKSINWNMIHYNRNNKSYKLIINIAYLILVDLFVNENNGNIEFRNYISEERLSYLYEKFILEYFRYHYNLGNPSEIRWNIDYNEQFVNLLPKMKTDITLCINDRSLIIDAKYYNNIFQSNPLYNKQTFRSNNLYQIYTYVKNKDIDKKGNTKGMLLYAKTDDNDESWAEYNLDGNKFIIANIDMSDSFEKVQIFLNSIADRFINNLL